MTNAQRTAADRYVRRIHNDAKRAYALAYLAWLRSGKTGPAPSDPQGCGYMAAQAVRMELGSIMRGGANV